MTNSFSVDAAPSTLHTLLIEAAEARDLAFFKHVVGCGADPLEMGQPTEIPFSDGEMAEGKLPLLVAAYNGSAAIVEYLLELGADPNARKQMSTVLALAVEGYGYSMRLAEHDGAVKADYTATMVALLRAGADIHMGGKRASACGMAKRWSLQTELEAVLAQVRAMDLHDDLRRDMAPAAGGTGPQARL
jgi:hypothetical protein